MVRLTGCPDMTLVFNVDVKQQCNNNNNNMQQIKGMIDYITARVCKYCGGVMFIVSISQFIRSVVFRQT